MKAIIALALAALAACSPPDDQNARAQAAREAAQVMEEQAALAKPALAEDGAGDAPDVGADAPPSVPASPTP